MRWGGSDCETTHALPKNWSVTSFLANEHNLDEHCMTKTYKLEIIFHSFNMIKMNHWDFVVYFQESVFTGQVKEPFSHWLYKDWRPFPNTCFQTVTDWWRFPNRYFQLLPYPQRISTVCLIWQILYMNCFSWYNPKVHYVSFCACGRTKEL